MHTHSVTHSCLTFYSSTDCSLLGSSVHRIFQARMQEWVAISYSRGSFQPRDQHRLFHFLYCTWILYHCATWEAHQWIKALQMLFIIYAVLNFPNFPQLLHIGLMTKKIQNVYNIALTLVTTVSKIMLTLIVLLFSVQFSSVTQSCPTLCDSMNRSTPGLPVHHQLPEFTQTHVHQVGDAIQPSQPLLSPSPPTPNPSQHQSLFQ